jgi:hypothetical protein
MTRKRSAIDHLNSGRQPHIVPLIPPGAPGYREADGEPTWALPAAGPHRSAASETKPTRPAIRSNAPAPRRSKS